MSSHCLNSFILSAIYPVYSTCLSHPEALCALPPGLEGRVQLFRNVFDLLGLSVNTAVVSHHMKTCGNNTDIHQFRAYSCRGNYGIVEIGLGGSLSGEQSSVGEGRPSESSLSRWTYSSGQRRLTHHLNNDKTSTNTDYSKAGARNAVSKSKVGLTCTALGC